MQKKSTKIDIVTDSPSAEQKKNYKNMKNEKEMIQSKLYELQRNLANGDSILEAQQQIKELIEMTNN